jgi:hypothetical protein
MDDSHGNDTQHRDNEPPVSEISGSSNPPQAPQARHLEDTAHSGLKKWYKNPIYVVSGCVGLFAFALVGTFAIRPLMQKRAHQTAERAWVRVQDATIVGPLIQHNVPRANILFHNTGRSPALMTKIRLVMTVWTSNRLPDWRMPPKLTTDAESVGAIDPGSTVSQAVSLIAPLTDEQGMYLERKDWFIVTLGVVSYVDIFGHPHETKLCLIWQETSTEHLSPCEKWNDAN